MYRHAYNTITKKLRRELVVRSLFFLPDDRRRHLERWLRGREEHRALHHTDVAIVSCGKSGRTWLRTLLSRFFQVRYDLGATTLISIDNFHYRHQDIPRVLFTHDTYMQYYTGNFASKLEYRSVKTLLLVRHPADVALSQYFQWKHRILPRKKWLNEYPAHNSAISIFDFVMDRHAGLDYVIGFLNRWRAEWSARPELTVVRYEDMLADPRGQLAKILRFLGFEATAAEIEECVSFASFENMRKLEEQGVLWLGGRALRNKEGVPTDGFKVRRGRAGGWSDYFTPQQVMTITRLVDQHLKPGFGYRQGERFPSVPTQECVQSPNLDPPAECHRGAHLTDAPALEEPRPW